MPEERLELSQGRPYWILSPARLPVPPLRHRNLNFGLKGTAFIHVRKLGATLGLPASISRLFRFRRAKNRLIAACCQFIQKTHRLSVIFCRRYL